jgi:phosphorylated CTD-interacting factor 1
MATNAGAGAAPPQGFERWRFAAKAAEDRAARRCGGGEGGGGGGARLDPALPSSDAAALALDVLVADLTRAGVKDADKAASIARDVADAAAREARALAKLELRLAAGKGGARATSSSDASAPATNDDVVARRRKHSVELTSRGKFVVTSRAAYARLRALYREHAPPCDGPVISEDSEEDDEGDDRDRFSSPAEKAFHRRLFALLLRYKSIHGYGFQASVGEEVFRALGAKLGVAHECFASPMNAHYGAFNGAFLDVDAPFGSAGDFFAVADRGGFRRGAYEANPPFVSGVMDAMVDAMELALTRADADAQPLTFAVFVPGWSDEPCWAKARPMSRRFPYDRVGVVNADP